MQSSIRMCHGKKWYQTLFRLILVFLLTIISLAALCSCTNDEKPLDDYPEAPSEPLPEIPPESTTEAGADEQPDDKWIIGLEIAGAEYLNNRDNHPEAASTRYRTALVFLIKKVEVISDIVECEGITCIGGIGFGFSGYSYRFFEDILYIHMRADMAPYWIGTHDGIFKIRIEDERVRDINRIILWDENESDNVTIWEVPQ